LPLKGSCYSFVGHMQQRRLDAFSLLFLPSHSIRAALIDIQCPMNQSPTFINGTRPRRRLPEWEKWTCDSCLDESHCMESPDKERYVAAGSFWVRRQRTGEPFYCPGHVGITPWAAFRPTRVQFALLASLLILIIFFLS
jgi:hypothetical protein